MLDLGDGSSRKVPRLPEVRLHLFTTLPLHEVA